jgi:phosphomannomutase
MNAGAPSSLDQRAEHWIAEDPDPVTSTELQGLLTKHLEGDTASRGALEELFADRLRFGTAGIRGPLRPGPAGMNRVVIGQTTAGLARYLLNAAGNRTPSDISVVIGCDARTNSEVFARDTAEVLSGYGIRAILLPSFLPTPVLAFAVRHLGADAGVMVTASHNPPQDNGYKVYLGNTDEGSQIVPPVDAEIEHHIITVAESLTWAEIPRSSEHVVSSPDTVVSSYINQTITSVVQGATSAPHPSAATPLSVVYTPMHGVGAGTFLAAVSAAGFPPLHAVSEQVEPDAAFPTVAFPNPEEKGALDLAFALAREVSADLVIAHDPDADRLALALPDSSAEAGYVSLTGNQVGAILGWHVAARAKALGQHGSLANSLVSSPVLGKIAEHFGLGHEETLTGFKYVSRVPGLLFGFEEALGYLVDPEVVRDKDGISAGLMALDLAYSLAEKGETLADYLHQIEAAVGGFASGQITLRLESSGTTPSVTDILRSTPPEVLGGVAVSHVDDFEKGVGAFPVENILRYSLVDGSRVIVRPSGTEPKLKIYLDTEGATSKDAREALVALEVAVRELLANLS